VVRDGNYNGMGIHMVSGCASFRRYAILVLEYSTFPD
jgi:hypothetical protein